MPATFEGDPGRLRQILTNLVGNAVKFTETGEVLVRVMRAGPPTDSPIRLYFEVRDTGMGIPPDVQARLFQSFAQADGSMSRRFGGTGLGLAISRRLVTLMGGELGVRSRVGDGSTFWFTATFEPDRSAPNTRVYKPLEDFRVLILDDKPTSRGILLGQLAGWGMRAFAEATEETARLALRAGRDTGDPFDCLLVDEPIGGRPGAELVELLDPAADLAATKVVVLGSSSGPGVTRSGGGVEFVRLAKPVGASGLLDCLVRLLVPAQEDAAPSPAKSRLADSLRRADAKILLVEDNEVNRKVACAILSRLGFTPDVAEDGYEAVRAAAKAHYDLILMDCQMPGMDGFTATGRIRDMEGGRQHATIVALTANATQADRERCLGAGMDDYVAKPVRFEAMSAMLARWLSRGRPASESPAAEAPAAPASESPAAPASESPAVPASESPAVPSAISRAGIPILDLEAMGEIRALDVDGGDFLGPLVDLFLEQASEQAAAIRAAIADGDAATLGATAHTLKGASRSVGASLVGMLAEELERRGKAGSAAETELAVELDAALESTRAAYLAERSDLQRRRASILRDARSPDMDASGEAA